MHSITGRWRLGLSLSLLTAIVWGLLPIGLKGVLTNMDPITVTWYRFLVAAMLIAPYLAYHKSLPNIKKLRGGVLLMAIVCILSLCFNYNFYVFGLNTIPASSAQVMIQFAPMLLLLGGLIIFKEKFSGVQWFGFFIFLCGIFLFFNQRLHELFTSLSDYTIGVAWIGAAAITWAGYALTQKQLLVELGSAGIMLLIYVVGVILMLPLIDAMQIFNLNHIELFSLLFCCLNTLIGYGAFAEALNHWEASRVSAVLATTPLFSIIFMNILEQLVPGFLPVEQLNVWSIVGALLVVFGSMITALYRNKELKAS